MYITPVDLIAMYSLPVDLIAIYNPPVDLIAMYNPQLTLSLCITLLFDLITMYNPPLENVAMYNPPVDLIAMYTPPVDLEGATQKNMIFQSRGHPQGNINKKVIHLFAKNQDYAESWPPAMQHRQKLISCFRKKTRFFKIDAAIRSTSTKREFVYS